MTNKDKIVAAIDAHKDYILEQTLADSIEVVDKLPDGVKFIEGKVGGITIRVHVSRVETSK